MKLKPPWTWEWLSRLHPWGAPWAPVSRWHSNKGCRGRLGGGSPVSYLPGSGWGPPLTVLLDPHTHQSPGLSRYHFPFTEDVGGGQAHQPALSCWAPGIRIPPDPGKPSVVGSPPPTSTWQRRLSMGEAAAPYSRSPPALPLVPSLARESENRDGSPGCLSPPHRLQRSPGAQLLRGRAGPGPWGLLASWPPALCRRGAAAPDGDGLAFGGSEWQARS